MPEYMSDFDELYRSVRKFRDDRDWKKFHTPKDIAMDIVVEAAELMEHFQWKQGEELDAYIRTHKSHISDELSDVLHGILIMCDELQIDIVSAFHKKMRENEKKYPVEKVKGRNIKHTEL